MTSADMPLGRAAAMAHGGIPRRHRLSSAGVAGLLLLFAIAALAMFAPLIAPYDPNAQNLAQRLVPPVWYAGGTWEHILGTDNLGRDYLSRIIYGARISLVIGLSVVAISGLIGTTIGVIAGYFGGRVDLAVTFVVALRLALPVTLVALAVVAILGSSLLIVILVLGFLKWDRFAVVIRASTQQLRALDYVTAAQVAGASPARIIAGEILPNLIPQLAVVASVEAASAILLEAALSFLGLGVQPPLPSWGLMISEAKAYMFFSFWQIALPGTALAILVLAINLVGDGVRGVTAPVWRM